jgi:hypothetical protein
MNRYFDSSWIRHAVLLGALAAGGLLTQVVPTYEEMAALREQPAPPSAASRARDTASRGVTGIEVDQRRLKSVRSIT